MGAWIWLAWYVCQLSGVVTRERERERVVESGGDTLKSFVVTKALLREFLPFITLLTIFVV